MTLRLLRCLHTPVFEPFLHDSPKVCVRKFKYCTATHIKGEFFEFRVAGTR